MNQRVLVVETDQKVFDDWTDPNHGLGARLEALGINADGLAIEQVKTADDMAEVAKDVKTAQSLPARVLLLQGIENADLGKHYESGEKKLRDLRPGDYDETTDTPWPQPGDWSGLLYPYTRLISRRLVQRAVPEVDFSPSDKVVKAWEAERRRSEASWRYRGGPRPFDSYRDLFYWGKSKVGAPHELVPEYGGWLRRINQHLAATGQDFMTIIDGRGAGPIDQASRDRGYFINNRYSPMRAEIVGADVNIVHPDIEVPTELMRTPGTGEVIKTLAGNSRVPRILGLGTRPMKSREAYDAWRTLANDPDRHWMSRYQPPRMWLAARILGGEYPGTDDVKPSVPRTVTV